MSAIDVERIRTAVGCDSLRVRAVDEIGSTNEALMAAPFGEHAAGPTLLAAASQSAGRGRRGRAWVSEPGRSLAFSIAFERLVSNQRPPAALAIAVGVAVANALAPWAADVRLKWPNDLQRDGRKLGGILVETRRSLPLAGDPQRSIERIVVGIGVNLATPKIDGRIDQPACGLFDCVASPDPAEIVIGRIAAAVGPAVERFLVDGLAPFVDAWHRLDALDGETVAVLDGDRLLVSGTASGIDANGGLRVATAAGMRVLSSGEVTLRRVRAERRTGPGS